MENEVSCNVDKYCNLAFHFLRTGTTFGKKTQSMNVIHPDAEEYKLRMCIGKSTEMERKILFHEQQKLRRIYSF